MITSTHTIIYADDAESARTFLQDVLGLKHVDSGGGWLIFRLPPSEVAVHPSDPEGAPSGGHQLYLMCDDIAATMDELRAKGVEFTSEISDQGWGLLTALKVPGAGTIGLYEPRHATAYDIE